MARFTCFAVGYVAVSTAGSDPPLCAAQYIGDRHTARPRSLRIETPSKSIKLQKHENKTEAGHHVG